MHQKSDRVSVLGFSRETEPIRHIERERKREIYYERLAHTIMKAEKTQDLPSAGWWPGNAGGVVPGQTQRAENERPHGLSSSTSPEAQ